MIPARRPDSGIGGSENRQRRGADSGREMRDAAVIADEEAGAREEAGDLVQIVDADRAGAPRAGFPRHTPGPRRAAQGRLRPHTIGPASAAWRRERETSPAASSSGGSRKMDE